MLQPARRKYRKEQKGRNTGVATRGATVAFGDFGLKSTDRGRLTARQIESARRAISRHVKRGGRIWIRVFPDKPISNKPAGSVIRRYPMKTAELRQKDVAGLQAEIKSLQKAHFGLRMQKATQQLNNTNTLRITRRAIARTKTILAEKNRAN